MRPDFPKVIVERPRYGGGISDPKGYKKDLQGDWDELAKREKIRQKWMKSPSYKEFSERLGPLKRYLYSKVGKAWNDIYSEIREHLSYDSVIQAHVMTHLYDYVALDVEWIDGVLCYKQQRRYGRLEVTASGQDQFYVDPDDGILKVIYTTGKYKYNWRKPKDLFWINKSELKVAMIIEGLYYECQLTRVPEDFGKGKYGYLDSKYDVCYRCSFNLQKMFMKYGEGLYCTSKRQLNSKEIRKYKLCPT